MTDAEKYQKLLTFVKQILKGQAGYLSPIEEDAEEILKEIG